MVPLPPPIRSYFGANALLDLDGMLAPFSSDAVVHDEKRTFRGTPEIRAWIREATIETKAIAAPEASRADGGAYHVAATVSGDFPGSPISMTFHFGLKEDRIAELAID